MISREHCSSFSEYQSQIEAIDHAVIQVTRQCEYFHIKMPTGFDVIYERSSPAKEQLQVFDLQLTSSLQQPKSLEHFVEHQLNRQKKSSVEHHPLADNCLRRTHNYPHRRRSIQHKVGGCQHSHLKLPVLTDQRF